MRIKTYFKIYKDLKMLSNIAGAGDPNHEVKVTQDDVGFILDEIWKGRSAISGSVDKDKTTLTRWDPSKPFEHGNIVCLTKKEVDAHHRLKSEQLTTFYPPEVYKFITSKLQEDLDAQKWRR
ncbi:hypothetical protein HDU76_011379 [Blyttiomyces sp. JEL0837]|nr:hypothetical protein HDU76_011379 [Blyttiomyces sp. JEL0837]